jgi:hypothetical protein
MGNKTIKRCLVEINTAPSVTIPDTVYEYEVAVLEELHGEQSVTVVSDKDVPLPDNFDAVDAYTQLERKYKTPKGADAIRFVYRNVQALAKASGLPYAKGDEDTVKYQQAVQVFNDPADQVQKDAAGKVAAAPGGTPPSTAP